MTCQECELKLGMGEDATEHLASCAECRWLAKELRLNAVALREMRVRPRMHWALAAAAAIVMVVFAWKMTRVEKLSLPPVRVAVAEKPSLAGHGPAPHRRAKKHLAPAEPLRVKMFTSDPDVVIYWIVDKKEGFE
jgi:hypothetical protein